MKVLFALSVLLVLLGLALGQYNVNCALEPIPVGPCGNRFSGYSYSDIRRRCVNFAARGCTIVGNFFYSRRDCEAECKPKETLQSNPLTFFINRAMDQARNFYSWIFNLP